MARILKLVVSTGKSGHNVISYAFMLILLWTSLGLAQQTNCGDLPKDIPKSTQEKLKGDVEGKAQLLTRLIGDAQLKGALETSKAELYQDHQDVDKFQIDRYFAWVACQNIMADPRLTSSQKNDQWMTVYRTLMVREQPRSDVSVAPRMSSNRTSGEQGTFISWKFETPTGIFDFDKADNYGPITAFHFVGLNASDHTIRRIKAYIEFERWQQTFPLYTLIGNQWQFPKESDTIPPETQFIFGCSLRSQLSGPPPCDQRPLAVPGDMGGFDFIFEADGKRFRRPFSIADIEKLIAKWDQGPPR